VNIRKKKPVKRLMKKPLKKSAKKLVKKPTKKQRSVPSRFDERDQEEAIARATEFFRQLTEQHQASERQARREIHHVVIWNAVDGSFRIEGIDPENSTVCTGSAGCFHEAVEIGARLAREFDVPCYCLRLSWIAANGKLTHLPSAMKPLHVAVATTDLHHVWN